MAKGPENGEIEANEQGFQRTKGHTKQVEPAK